MKTQPLCRLLALLGLAFTAEIHAQFVSDGGTLVTITPTDLSPSDLIVGTNAGNTTLGILSPGTLTNVNGTIGLSETSTNNLVAVRNAGAIWNNTGDLYVGDKGPGNLLVVTNGGRAFHDELRIGNAYSAQGNQAVVTGDNSLLSGSGGVYVGYDAPSNSLLIANGATLANNGCSIGGGFGFGAYDGASNNWAVVTGPGTHWTNTAGLIIGNLFNSGNRLVVSNGAVVASYSGSVGTLGADNTVVVTGPGSLWANSGDLVLSGTGSQLIVENSGTVSASNQLVGATGSADNLLQVNGGAVTLAATLDVRNGTLKLDSGTVTTGTLLLTNGSSSDITFHGGTLSASNATVDMGSLLVAGNGTSPAAYEMLGGLHTFDVGLTVSSNATFAGSGTISGFVNVTGGGKLAPGGSSSGRIVFNNAPVISGQALMQISRNGPTLTNDLIQLTGGFNWQYDGSLTVTKAGATDLTAGNSFKLFEAAGYTGAFTSVSLPTLNPGLNWTNRLPVDGSIAVVTWSGPKLSGVGKSGTNLMFKVTDGVPGGAYELLTSQNIAMPLASWNVIDSGSFDWLGSKNISVPISPVAPQRFFTIRVP